MSFVGDRLARRLLYGDNREVSVGVRRTRLRGTIVSQHTQTQRHTLSHVKLSNYSKSNLNRERKPCPISLILAL